MKRRVRGHLRLMTALVVAYWLALFVATHMPLPAIGTFPHSDKWMHFGAYAGLAWLVTWAFSQKGRLSFAGYLGVAGLIALYGVVDELLQMIPALHRSADPIDWLADMAGASLAIVAFAVTAGRFSSSPGGPAASARSTDSLLTNRDR